MLPRAMDMKQPDAPEIEDLAYEAFTTIPAVLQEQVKGVAIRVVDLPDRADDQVLWLGEAGFTAGVVWSQRDLAVIRAVRA